MRRPVITLSEYYCPVLHCTILCCVVCVDVRFGTCPFCGGFGRCCYRLSRKRGTRGAVYYNSSATGCMRTTTCYIFVAGRYAPSTHCIPWSVKTVALLYAGGSRVESRYWSTSQHVFSEMKYTAGPLLTSALWYFFHIVVFSSAVSGCSRSPCARSLSSRVPSGGRLLCASGNLSGCTPSSV